MPLSIVKKSLIPAAVLSSFTLAAPAAEVDLSIGAEQYPDADAIILRWEQEWTLAADGSVSRREHQWVKLLDVRAIDHYGDPRIDFNAETDTLIVHEARTHLPDGTIMPVPDYSFNPAAPDDLGGWPAWADWEQQIISFSGIVNGCVLELHYEVQTKPGVLENIEADLRLEVDEPTVQRLITVNVPVDIEVGWTVDYVTTDPDSEEHIEGDVKTLRWVFNDLPGARGEDQSPIWQERCGRLLFTTMPSVPAWTERLTRSVREAATPDDAIRAFAKTVTQDEHERENQLEALATKLNARFTHITPARTMRAFDCRMAGEVFRYGYGNPLEAGAVLLACCKALRINAMPTVAVDARTFNGYVPTRDALTGIVVVVRSGDTKWLVHPQHGVIRNPGSWGDHLLIGTGPDGSLDVTPISARGSAEESTIEVTGRIDIDEDMTATGAIVVTVTGGFFDPTELETAQAQEKYLGVLAGRLLDGWGVRDHAITALSDELLRATLTIGTDGPLAERSNFYALALGNEPIALGTITMPVHRTARRTELQLTGPFHERIDLVIALPDGVTVAAAPAPMAPLSGEWGTASQTVQINTTSVHFNRELAVQTARIAPADYPAVRTAVTRLSAPGGRTFMLLNKD